MGEHEHEEILKSGAAGFEPDELTQAEAVRIAAEIDGDTQDEEGVDSILGEGDE